MEIKINKDLDSYKSKDFAGRFSLQEVGVGIVAGVIGGGAMYVAWKVTGELYPLIFLVVAFPIMFITLGKVQGHGARSFLKLIQKRLVYKKHY